MIPPLPWPVELDPEQVLERFRWARQQGHPLYLWPEVAPAALHRGLAEIERVTSALLRSERPRLDVEGAAELRALGVAGYTSGMGPLLGYWLETDRVDASPLARRLFAVHLAHGRLRAERLKTVLYQATGALVDAGVSPLVLKGSHTAAVYFPEPGTRPALDVDLAVTPDAFDTAEEALARAGYTLAVRERNPRKAVWSAPSAARLPRSFEILHAGSQYVVDLQESLERQFHGVRAVRPTTLTPDTGIPAPELGAQVRVLGQPELLLYNALHVSQALGSLTLVRIVELVLMIRQDVATGALDWRAFRSLVQDQDAGRFVYPALTMVEKLAPGTIDHDVLGAIHASTNDRVRRVVGRLTVGGAQPLEGIALDERFMWCTTPAEHLRRIALSLVLAPGEGWLKRIARVYRDRFYRLVRGRVSLRRSGNGRSTGPLQLPQDPDPGRGRAQRQDTR
jgi:hypothetical protein